MNNIMIIITLTSVDFILSLNGGKSCLRKAPSHIHRRVLLFYQYLLQEY